MVDLHRLAKGRGVECQISLEKLLCTLENLQACGFRSQNALVDFVGVHVTIIARASTYHGSELLGWFWLILHLLPFGAPHRLTRHVENLENDVYKYFDREEEQLQHAE